MSHDYHEIRRIPNDPLVQRIINLEASVAALERSRDEARDVAVALDRELKRTKAQLRKLSTTERD